METVSEEPEKNPGEKWRWIDNGDFERFEIETESVVRERNEYPIPLWEPMAEFLLSYATEDGRDWLFPTPQKPTRPPYKGIKAWLGSRGYSCQQWISSARAWQIVKDLGRRTLIDVWAHWFRSQRGRQLYRDYLFETNMLNRWFGWRPRARSTADRYVNPGLYNLMDQMILQKQSHLDKLAADRQRYEL